MTAFHQALDALHNAGLATPCEHPTEQLSWVSDHVAARRYAALQCRTTCPLTAECYAYARATRTEYHVWGGHDFTTPNASACGTRTGYDSHLREGTTPCPPCRAAVAQYQRDYQHRRGAATA